jgi:tetratricopeptide (TPR) repeat protein
VGRLVVSVDTEATLGVALLACGAAWMNASPVARAADGGDAKTLVQAGAEQFTRMQYDAARESFAQAYALDPQAATVLDLALAELQTKRPVEAAAHFRAYLARPDADQDKRGAVEAKWLPRAEAQLARVQLVVPAGAQVLVDGVPATPDAFAGARGGAGGRSRYRRAVGGSE